MKVLVSLTLGGIVSEKSAAETSSFTNAFGFYSEGEFEKGDGVNIHGIWVRGGLRGGQV